MKPIDLVHKYHGKRATGTCGKCDHFKRYRAGEVCNRSLRKCLLYGLSHSEATDWCASWPACNRYNEDITGLREVRELAALNRQRNPAEPMEGQESLFGGNDNA